MISEADRVALVQFVNTCEEGRAGRDRLVWMVGTSSGGEYVARVMLGNKQHAASGATLRDAVNALGEKLILADVVRFKS